MPETLAQELLDLVKDLAKNAATKADLEQMANRVSEVETTLNNGLRTEVKEIAATVDSLRSKHKEEDASMVSLRQQGEGKSKRWSIHLNITPTRGWLTSLGLAALVLLTLLRGSASSAGPFLEELLKSLY